MINERSPANGLVALMAIVGGQDGGWELREKGGELYIVPQADRRARRTRDRATRRSR